MGIFNGFKQALNIGGVGVQVSAPATLPPGEAMIPVTITVTTKSPQTVNRVVARFVQVPRNAAQTGAREAVLSESDNTLAFSISPGEEKTFEFQLPHHFTDAITAAIPQDNAVGKGLVGALGVLEKVSNAAGVAEYNYVIRGTAEVAGTTLNPSHEVYIIPEGIGQIGGNFRIDV